MSLAASEKASPDPPSSVASGGDLAFQPGLPYPRSEASLDAQSDGDSTTGSDADPLAGWGSGSSDGPEDTLLGRLKLLAARNLDEELFSDEYLDALHDKLDEFEALADGTTKQKITGHPTEVKAELPEAETNTPVVLGSVKSMRLESSPQRSKANEDRKRQTAELEAAFSRLSFEFRRRVEELKHVNDVTIMKVEIAAQMIWRLRGEVEQLKSDLSADQSELMFLKLQLKTVEVQALAYIPAEDKDLTAGIQRWKLDWADIDQRIESRARRREQQGHDTGSIYSGTFDQSNIGSVTDDSQVLEGDSSGKATDTGEVL
ncbi:MAG: hypothetical protein M1832_003029 [Thelocarpon impressellum]|nr:MAG: hypothetical protein M1832_003029 [Thelocarpon impressellum]